MAGIIKYIVLLIAVLIQTLSFSQENTIKTIPVDYDSMDYSFFIRNQVEKLKKDNIINWVFCNPVKVKIKSNNSNVPPAPPNILSFKNEDFTFGDDIGINIICDTSMFDFSDEESIMASFKLRKKKHGIGVVFSLPYKWTDDNTIFIDYQIINWDYMCSTGTYQTVKYK